MPYPERLTRTAAATRSDGCDRLRMSCLLHPDEHGVDGMVKLHAEESNTVGVATASSSNFVTSSAPRGMWRR